MRARRSRRDRATVTSSIEQTRKTACPLCERPNLHPSDHHMVPKSRGGRATTTLCRDCHLAIHATFTNKELETSFNTAEALLAHAPLAAMIRFIARQDPGGKVRVRPSKNKGRALR